MVSPFALGRAFIGRNAVMIASCKSPSNRDTCTFLFSFQFAQIEHLATFYDVGQQNIYEGVLPIKRGTSPIFGRNDSIDCSEVAFAERVVFRATETSTPSVGLFGIGPIVHDAPVYERRYPFRPIPSMQQQSIAVVWSVVDDKTCQSDWGVPFRCVRVHLRRRAKISESSCA